MSRFHRYFKKCEEFALCAEVSDGNVVQVEDKSERYTLYQIVVKGSGRMGKIFDNDYIVGDVNGVYFADLKESDVTRWVETSLGTDQINHYKSVIEEVIQQKATPTVVRKYISE